MKTNDSKIPIVFSLGVLAILPLGVFLVATSCCAEDKTQGTQLFPHGPETA